MRFQLLSILPLLTTTTTAADIIFSLPPTPHFPNYNPSSLPSSTHATLFRHANTRREPVTRRNTFDFHNVTQGSYLFTVQCRDYTFGPLRVDVLPLTLIEMKTSSLPPGANANVASKEKVDVFQTFWGNEWGNKGEWRGGGIVDVIAQAVDGRDAEGKGEAKPVVVQVVPDGVKEYYIVRTGFSPLEFLKNPMILMALFSLVLIVAIPWITDNMDEETRAEFEEMQRKSPVSQVTSGAAMQNFDLASWMAGRSTAVSSATDASGAK